MRDLLQKPWFVGLLSVIALIIVYFNVIDPLIEDGSSSSVVADISPTRPFSSETSESIDTSKMKMVNWDAMAVISPDRNPFSPMKAVRLKSGKRWINWPAVSAIVIGSSEKFAIVNGNVVQEGQKSGKFKVISIAGNSVRLRYGNREKTLKVHARGGK
ncbi:hypothetical protein MMIC_P1695 [Mariprofundus micogutta]|uniref:Uncharacterized protein n=2 Tax=Mariprofundus micogutta TaxID=1921010 RepID=A0A1L8CP73_9PROT|nr:hypothetical protein MMIC_P1695 [Mariprofundus micogutta]